MTIRNMSLKEIRSQLMASAGLVADGMESLFSKANAAMYAKDHENAYLLAKKAADLGHVGAAYITGLCYANGLGVVQNLANAKTYFQQAAASGNPHAKTSLAWMAFFGNAPDIDQVEMAQLLQDASDAGVAEATALLGNLYEQGTGVPRDLSVAVELFERAVQAGDAMAFASLSQCYQKGRGVEKDLYKALDLIRVAEEKGWGGADKMRLEIEVEIQGR